MIAPKHLALSIAAAGIIGWSCGQSSSSPTEVDAGVDAETADAEIDDRGFDATNDGGSSTSDRIASLDILSGAACVLFEDGRFDCWAADPELSLEERYSIDYSIRFRELRISGLGICGIDLGDHVRCFGFDTPSLTGRYRGLDIGVDGEVCALGLDGTVACDPGGNFGGAGEWVLDVEFSGAFDDFAVGRGWGCGLLASGALECSEHPFDGRPGYSAPQQQHRTIEGKHQVVCGLRADQGVECWGYFVDASQRTYPTSGEFTTLTFSGSSGCVLNPDGQPTCWPDIGADPPDIRLKLIDTWSSRVTCGVTLDDKVLCWGSEAADLNAAIPPEIAYQPEP